ncbi:MAG TPA: RteC domain-containing protein [Ignavibacteriaceae bacterium]|nr:RteC domain-containing protein [Ignavibacteriaceae bacterium]
MQSGLEQLYDEMLTAISDKQKQPNKTDLVESCFWIASKYWGMVKKSIDDIFFTSQVNEINFFRNLKPKFTSQIQYYSMIAEVSLFVPENAEIQMEFWRDELKRYRRFCDRNKDFVQYYESKAVYLDSIYFVRVGLDWVPPVQPVTYDADKKFCSSHDHLVRGLLAHQMYHAFVQEKLLLVKSEF